MSGTRDDLDRIANIAQGLAVAWDHLTDRIPSQRFDRPRVHTSSKASPPTFDPEVQARYFRAQTAIRFAYYRVVAMTSGPFWPDAHHYAKRMAHPELLVSVLAGIRRNIDVLDDNGRRDLAAAEKALKPFWQTPPPPRMCRSGCGNPAAVDRKDCWTCSSKRRTKRQVRVR